MKELEALKALLLSAAEQEAFLGSIREKLSAGDYERIAAVFRRSASVVATLERSTQAGWVSEIHPRPISNPISAKITAAAGSAFLAPSTRTRKTPHESAMPGGHRQRFVMANTRSPD